MQKKQSRASKCFDVGKMSKELSLLTPRRCSVSFYQSYVGLIESFSLATSKRNSSSINLEMEFFCHTLQLRQTRFLYVEPNDRFISVRRKDFVIYAYESTPSTSQFQQLSQLIKYLLVCLSEEPKCLRNKLDLLVHSISIGLNMVKWVVQFSKPVSFSMVLYCTSRTKVRSPNPSSVFL